MDIFSTSFWEILISIIIIDLVLAGDNAIVIGLAARNLPQQQQKKVIFWGTFGAITIRSLLTLIVVKLLEIPGLLLAGGILLIWIAYKLLVEEKSHDNIKSGDHVFSAIKTIIIADTVMGLDNVLAVAGAAHGNFFMVILGLLVSIPIVIWGSTIILKWVDRFPIIIYIGSGVLAWTAAKMIVDETFLKQFFENQPIIKWVLTILIIVGVLLVGRIKRENQKNSLKKA